MGDGPKSHLWEVAQSFGALTSREEGGRRGVDDSIIKCVDRTDSFDDVDEMKESDREYSLQSTYAGSLSFKAQARHQLAEFGQSGRTLRESVEAAKQKIKRLSTNATAGGN